MKKFMSLIMVLAIANLMFTSCEKNANDPPELPPYESMSIDFSDFSAQKSAESSAEAGIWSNYQWAGLNVFVFNVILTGTLVVPVAAFQAAIHQTPVFIGDATWEWSFTVDGFGGAYTARLTGEVASKNDVIWEMYITKTGIGAFAEFMWYSGTSKSDGSGGQWLLNHGAVYQEPMLQIDWERSGEEVGEVKYTVVRDLNDRDLYDNRSVNEAKGSYIVAGKTEADLNAFYNIYQADESRYVFIEWSTTNFNGHVKDELYFLDSNWHCWGSDGLDVACE